MEPPHSGVHHGAMNDAHPHHPGRRSGRAATSPAAPPRPGFTLIEMLIVLSVLGVLLVLTLPPVARWRDAAAVHAARDELAAALAWTRVAAASRSGATLVLDPETGRFWTVAAAGAAAPPTDLGSRYRVRLDVGSSGPVLFHYDALGIGRLTSRTVHIRRRGAEAGLTVSAYGRVRRW